MEKFMKDVRYISPSFFILNYDSSGNVETREP